MDVVVVRRVVDGFEETPELTRGSAVDDQDEGDPYRHELGSIWRVLVPLYVHISLTWTEKTKTSAYKTNSILFFTWLLTWFHFNEAFKSCWECGLCQRSVGEEIFVSELSWMLTWIYLPSRPEMTNWLVDKQKINWQPFKNRIIFNNILHSFKDLSLFFMMIEKCIFWSVGHTKISNLKKEHITIMKWIGYCK